MQFTTRKEKEITTPFVNKSKWLWYILLFITFLFAGLYQTRSAYFYSMQMVESFAVDVGLNINTFNMFAGYVAFNALLSVVILELMLTIYYYLGYQRMRRIVPFSMVEFKKNMYPFMVVRNIIWALLSILMWTENGYFIGVGYMAFEMLSTMIIIFPAFYFFKKHYIKEGYGYRTLMAFVLPYVIINTLNVVSVLF